MVFLFLFQMLRCKLFSQCYRLPDVFMAIGACESRVLVGRAGCDRDTPVLARRTHQLGLQSADH